MPLHRYIVALGSNIEAEKNTERALAILGHEQNLISRSQFRQTAPVGYQNQDSFLNGAVYVESSLDYEDFRLYLKEVEKRLDRVKGPIKSGPRTMDLDIIVHNNKLKDLDFHNPSSSYMRKPVQELLEQENIKLIESHTP